MIPHAKQLHFPFSIDQSGRVKACGGDEAIRGMIIQVLFTSHGERINNPEFGCGLFNLVFETNNELLASVMEFTIGEALTRWMGDEIIVEAIRVSSREESAVVEIAYTRKYDLSHDTVRITF